MTPEELIENQDMLNKKQQELNNENLQAFTTIVDSIKRMAITIENHEIEIELLRNEVMRLNQITVKAN